MNLVLVSGVMRSGSTWAFNVCRSLCMSASKSLGLPFSSDYLEGEALNSLIGALSAKMVVVVKTHDTLPAMRSLVEDGAVRNVCTIREPRDCVASRRLFKSESFEESIGQVKASFADAQRYGPKTMRIMYQDLMERPVDVVMDIAEHLLLVIERDHAEKIVQEFSMENMRRWSETISEESGAEQALHGGLVDPATAIHTGHINGGEIGRYWTELTKKQIRKVEQELADEIEWYETLRNKRLN